MLGKYITGNIDEQIGSNIPIFDNNSSDIENNIMQDINIKLFERENATNVLLLGKIYNNKYSNLLLYGFYETDDGYYGFIYLVDTNLKEIALLTEFSSGTKIFPIIALNQDENNYIYGLSYNLNENAPTTRVLLLNNIFTSNQLTGTYSVILRNSYIVPNSNITYRPGVYNQCMITKLQGEATYYIVLYAVGTGNTALIEFKINVGSSNEWNVYTIPGMVDRVKYALVPYNNNGTMEIHYYSIDIYDSYNPTYNEYMLREETLSLVNSIQINTNVFFAHSQVFYKNINEIYMVINATVEHKIYLYKIVGNNLITIWETELEPNEDNQYYLATLYLFMVNDVVFCNFRKIYTAHDIRQSVGIIQDDVMYFSNVVNSTISYIPDLYNYVDLYVIPNYNLINIYIPKYDSQVTTHKLSMVYNTTNYNGNEYEDVNSLIPDNSIIYNEDNEMIFARNLYDRTIYNSSSTSTLEIPNTLLNNDTISQSDLIGETNKVLISDSGNITKNIYEKLYINFINTINVIDEDNNVLYQETASNINSNINSSLNVDNTLMNNKKIAKMMINCEDATCLSRLIQLTQINDTQYTIEGTFYVDNNIDTIDIVSYDETFKYLTIDGSNLEVGKTYTFSQSLRIE